MPPELQAWQLWLNLGALPLFLVNIGLWWRVDRRLYRVELLMIHHGLDGAPLPPTPAGKR